MNEFFTLAEDLKFTHWGSVNIEALVSDDRVRDMCMDCNQYAKRWSCPPACGSIESLQKNIREFKNGVILQSTFVIDNEFDFTAMVDGEKIHKQRFDSFISALKNDLVNFLPLSSGTCTRCIECTYPKSPCRFPDRLYSSMEAYGLLVSEICESSGLLYNYGKNTITYTSCVLY